MSRYPVQSRYIIGGMEFFSYVVGNKCYRDNPVDFVAFAQSAMEDLDERDDFLLLCQEILTLFGLPFPNEGPENYCIVIARACRDIFDL